MSSPLKRNGTSRSKNRQGGSNASELDKENNRVGILVARIRCQVSGSKSNAHAKILNLENVRPHSEQGTASPYPVLENGENFVKVGSRDEAGKARIVYGSQGLGVSHLYLNPAADEVVIISPFLKVRQIPYTVLLNSPYLLKKVQQALDELYEKTNRTQFDLSNNIFIDDNDQVWILDAKHCYVTNTRPTVEQLLVPQDWDALREKENDLLSRGIGTRGTLYEEDCLLSQNIKVVMDDEEYKSTKKPRRFRHQSNEEVPGLPTPTRLMDAFGTL